MAITRVNKQYSSTSQSYVVSLSDTSSDVATGTNVESFTLDFQCRLNCVFIEVETAPTGASLIIDAQYGGESIFVDKPTIEAGETQSIDITSFSKDLFTNKDVLKFNIDQVGSTVAGTRLKAHLIIDLL